MNAKEIVSRLTLEEKASLCSGADFWNIEGLERFGIKPAMVTDGPHGLRKQAGETDHLGINNSVPATCFPTACTTACSFDRDLMQKMGNALGEECLQENVAVLLGPGANLKRSPLCGRNFEYISEDPYVTGEIAAALIGGIQEKGVGTSMKHFAANNQEKMRLTSNSIIDERTLRELYLAGFETAVKKVQPWTLMCSYNKINGVYSCENLKLLTEILRDEWGFKGLVMTDWGAINERVNGVVAGLDLEMPGSEGVNDAKIVKAVQDGTLTEKAVDICALRVVELLLKAEENRKTGYKYDVEEHHQLAKTVAAQSAVLLKNDENILPISPTQNILVIGEFAKTPRYQGAGSSKINPLKIDTALNSMRVTSNSITYEDGYSLQNNANDKILREQACIAAKDKDVVVIFAGLPDAAESEGFDRTTLSLPESHNRLIEEVCKVNKNVVVVLLCGAPVVMPWKNDVKGILLTYLGGQAGGSACVDLLYGRANPSGKLAETFPLCIQDTSAYLNFAKTAKTAEYRESIFVGYRWYDGAKREVAYPFGFGLSYTTFEYSDLKISNDTFDTQGIIKVEVTIKNTGSCFGGEVAQLYVQAPQDGVVYRAPRELKGFEKVFLPPNKSETVVFTLDKRSFVYYNSKENCWAVEGGIYTVAVGSSSRDLPLQGQIKVQGDGKEKALAYLKNDASIYYNLPQRGIFEVDAAAFEAVLGMPIPPAHRQDGEPITKNSTLGEIKDTEIGNNLLQLMRTQSKEMGEDLEALFSAMILDMPLRALSMMSSGAVNDEQIDEMINALNRKNG